MEVPRLGSNQNHSHWPMPQAQQHQIPTASMTMLQLVAMLDPLTHWLRPGIEAMSFCMLVRFFTHWATTGTPSLCVSLDLKWVSYRQHKCRSYFCFCSATRCLWIGAFNSFAYKVIIDMNVHNIISLFFWGVLFLGLICSFFFLLFFKKKFNEFYYVCGCTTIIKTQLFLSSLVFFFFFCDLVTLLVLCLDSFFVFVCVSIIDFLVCGYHEIYM